MDDSLRGYNRRLLRNLMGKERQLSDLREEFAKLRHDHFRLKKAFESNFGLHDELVVEIDRLRGENDEHRRAENDCSNESLRLRDQLRVTRREKEKAQEGMSYWKKESLSRKEYYESRYAETLRIAESRLKANRMEFDKELEEMRQAARKYVAELTSRTESNEKKVQAIERKLIALRADLDLRTYRREELIRKLVSFPEVGAKSETICKTIARALQSLDSSGEDHEQRMTEFEGEMLRQLASLSAVISSNDYEKLETQNRVLREVVKKLKKDSREDRKREVENASKVPARGFDSTSAPVEIFVEMEEAAKIFHGMENLSANPPGNDASLRAVLRLKKSGNLRASRNVELVNRVLPGKFAQDERRSNNYFETVKPPSFDDNDPLESPSSSWNKRVARFNEQTILVRLKFEDADLAANESPLYDDGDNCVADFTSPTKTKINHRGVQTLPAAVKTVSTQTTDSAVTARKSFAGTKMTNCEKRAIERSLRALERTVDEARCEILEEARLFGRGKKHVDGKKFLDCVENLTL